MGSRFTGDTKDPAVNVTTWVLLVTIIFSVSARLGTKFRLFKKLTVDDLLIIASLVFGIGQSIVVSLAVGSGYGKHYKDVSSAEADQVMKVHIFLLVSLEQPFILPFPDPRLTRILAEPLRRVSSVHPQPDVLETIDDRIHPESYTIVKRQMARTSSQGHCLCLGSYCNFRDCIPMLCATHMGFLEWPML